MVNDMSKKQATLFQTWGSLKQEKPKKTVIVNEDDPIILDDEDDEMLLQALQLSSQEAATGVDGCQIENLPGFDVMAGRTWIYPTNYPCREYQFEMVRQALFNNTMVILPTGLGKTLIAAVVMYNFYRWYPQGKIVFMAPARPLVAQQIEACFNVMGIPQEDTVEMTGSMQPEARKYAWRKKRVFFLTPQIISNDLSRSVCVATEVKCLVVDEAHKALGNHAYCQVVKELVTYSNQFRLLALTATPGSDLKAVHQVLSNLLISHVEMRTDESPDIQPYTHSRNIEKIVVHPSEEMKELQGRFLGVIAPYVNRLEKNGAISSRDPSTLSKFGVLKLKESFSSNPPRAMDKRQYGMIQADFALCISLYHAYELLSLHGTRSCYRFVSGILEGEKGQNCSKAELARNLSFQEIVENMREKYKDVQMPSNVSASKLFQNSFAEEPKEESSFVYGHPKLQKLEDIVVNHFKNFKHDANTESTRVMIFSQYRESVHEITDMLQRHRPLVRAMSFIGQNSATTSARGFTQKMQIKVVRQFREGGFNTLISTCVGEEGLDIGEVDLIVCFDAPKSATRLVQRMGRTGRCREGRIVVLVSKGKEEQSYNQSHYNKRNIHRALSGGTAFSNLYPHNPRMIPLGLDPSCHRMFMTVGAYKEDPKKAAAKSTIPSKERKGTVTDELLTDEELAYWNRELKIEDETPIPILSITSPFLSLPKHEPLQESTLANGSKPQLLLNNWIPWQTSEQPVHMVGHSKRTRLLVEMLHSIEMQQGGAEEENRSFHQLKKRPKGLRSWLKSKGDHRMPSDDDFRPDSSVAKKMDEYDDEPDDLDDVMILSNEESHFSVAKEFRSPERARCFIRTPPNIETFPYSSLSNFSPVNISDIIRRPSIMLGDSFIWEGKTIDKIDVSINPPDRCTAMEVGDLALEGPISKQLTSIEKDIFCDEECSNASSVFEKNYLKIDSLHQKEDSSDKGIKTFEESMDVEQTNSCIDKTPAKERRSLSNTKSEISSTVLNHHRVVKEERTCRRIRSPSLCDDKPAIPLLTSTPVRASKHSLLLDDEILDDFFQDDDVFDNSLLPEASIRHNTTKSSELLSVTQLITMINQKSIVEPDHSHEEIVSPSPQKKLAPHCKIAVNSVVQFDLQFDLDDLEEDLIPPSPEPAKKKTFISKNLKRPVSSSVSDLLKKNTLVEENAAPSTDISSSNPEHSKMRILLCENMKHCVSNSEPENTKKRTLTTSSVPDQTTTTVLSPKRLKMSPASLNLVNTKKSTVLGETLKPSVAAVNPDQVKMRARVGEKFKKCFMASFPEDIKKSTRVGEKFSGTSAVPNNAKLKSLVPLPKSTLISEDFILPVTSSNSEQLVKKTLVDQNRKHSVTASAPDAEARSIRPPGKKRESAMHRNWILDSALSDVKSEKEADENLIARSHFDLGRSILDIIDDDARESQEVLVTNLPEPTRLRNKKNEDSLIEGDDILCETVCDVIEEARMQSEVMGTVERGSRVAGGCANVESVVIDRTGSKEKIEFGSRDTKSLSIGNEKRPRINKLSRKRECSKSADVPGLPSLPVDIKKNPSLKEKANNDGESSDEEVHVVGSRRQKKIHLDSSDDNSPDKSGHVLSSSSTEFVLERKRPRLEKVRRAKKGKTKKPKDAKKDFIDEEAMESFGIPRSADESEGSSLDEYDSSFVADAEEQISVMNPEDDIQAVYLRSVRSPEHVGKFKLQFDFDRDVNVFSQVPNPNEESSDYEEDSFCVRSEPKKPKVSKKGGVKCRRRIVNTTSSDEDQASDMLVEDAINMHVQEADVWLTKVPEAPAFQRKMLQVAAPMANRYTNLKPYQQLPVKSVLENHKLEVQKNEREQPASCISNYPTTDVDRNAENNPQSLVFVDTREIVNAQAVVSCLRATYRVKTVVRQVEGAGYVLSRRMAAERMRLSEFSNGQNRKKLLEKIRNMFHFFVRPCLIIEKDPVKSGEKAKAWFRTKYVDNTLCSLMKTHLKILFTDTSVETASLLSDLVKQEEKKGMGIFVNTDLSPEKEQVLQFYLTLPSVSITTAFYFLEKLKSISAITKCTPEDLQRIGNVSRTCAQSIYDHLMVKFTSVSLPAT